MLNYILLLLVLLLICGFFSAAEIAFVTGNKLKIEIRARKKNLAARSALYFTNDPRKFFSTILLGSTILNITFASLSALFLYSMFGLSEINILIISTLVMLIFGELLPKYLSREIADRVVFIAAIPLRVISFVLTPLVKVTSSVSSLFIKSIKKKAI
jgi:CBS domain containing-hemolysin-like protein